MKTTLRDIEPELQKNGTAGELQLLREELQLVRDNASRFTSVVAHDLQSPLRMITGFLDLLSGRYGPQLDEKAKQYIGLAVQGAEKMKQLIRDLQLYASLYNDSSQPEETDLRLLITELHLKNAHAWEDLEINWPGAETLFINGKRKQISLLFEELLNNAVKFCKNKQPFVNISTQSGARRLTIVLADRGIGFDPSFRENIFDVFRKLHPDDGRFEGTGIGLALCKRICEIHGWEIRADSVPGEGAEISLIIPVSNQSSKSC